MSQDQPKSGTVCVRVCSAGRVYIPAHRCVDLAAGFLNPAEEPVSKGVVVVYSKSSEGFAKEAGRLHGLLSPGAICSAAS